MMCYIYKTIPPRCAPSGHMEAAKCEPVTPQSPRVPAGADQDTGHLIALVPTYMFPGRKSYTSVLWSVAWSFLFE